MADQMVTCPICNRQGNIEDEFGIHLSICRKNLCSTDTLWDCCYNSMHVLPIRERFRHLDNCPDRPNFENVMADANYSNGQNDVGTPQISNVAAKAPTIISFDAIPPNMMQRIIASTNVR